MIKQLILYSAIFLLLYLVGYHIHNNYLVNNTINFPFSIKKVYLFHLGFSLLICVNFTLLSTVDKIFQQLGFIYLVTLVLKLVLFCIIFYKSIINQENLALTARISLLIPTIIFLLTEVIFVAKILNKKG
ncbi:DUF6168 family protein [Polaribacter porphyrae]|uniref:Uncharacterized protein n=1 Tax=Polaribacter porphyrae TaxID=1137780 RepID=A0A2S7WQE9_9FLAO|nr:DUF6168 family protein [Polaribacter porphyrae]PQJ79848.1 hypothetical protein BTO18_11965 [Polaribacter porphyrae]